MKALHFLSPIYKRIYFLMKLPFMSKTLGGSFLYQVKYILKYSEPDNFYVLYNFKSKTKEERNEYLPYPTFRKQRNFMNQKSFSFISTAEKFNYICLLRDKFYFGQFLTSLGFITPTNRFLIYGDVKRYYNIEKRTYHSLQDIIKEDFDCYCKVSIGECGKGVFHLQISNNELYINGAQSSYEDFLLLIGNGIFLVQDTVIQHPIMQLLYPKSVNTLRIITGLKSNGETIFISGCLRVGAHGNTVDNWAAGGLDVGVTDDGKLKGCGHYEFMVNGKLEEEKHPDTSICFNGYKIPFYKEAVDTALLLHKMFYGIGNIGWDIAITEKGPCFIEGNDNYEISLNQVVDGGLKRKWDELFKSY